MSFSPDQNEIILKATTKGATSLPQTTQSAFFNVEGGAVYAKIEFEVTTVIQAQANNMKIVANPDTGADVDLCAVTDINADAVGTMYTPDGRGTDFSAAMVATTSGAHLDYGFILIAPGSIDVSCSASSTGAIKGRVLWYAAEPGAYVTAA